MTITAIGVGDRVRLTNGYGDLYPTGTMATVTGFPDYLGTVIVNPDNKVDCDESWWDLDRVELVPAPKVAKKPRATSRVMFGMTYVGVNFTAPLDDVDEYATLLRAAAKYMKGLDGVVSGLTFWRGDDDRLCLELVVGS